MRKTWLGWDVSEVCSCYENSLRCVLVYMWLVHILSYIQVMFGIKNKTYEGVQLFPVSVFSMSDGVSFSLSQRNENFLAVCFINKCL